MYVRLRSRIGLIQHDIDLHHFLGQSENDDDLAEDYNSDTDEETQMSHLRVAWYQFSNNSTTV